MSRRRRTGIAMPWEGDRTWLRRMVSIVRSRVLLVVAVILIAGYAAWSMAARADDIRSTRARIAEVHRAVAAFRTDLGRCPASTDELVRPPDGGKRYLRDIPRDAWDTPVHMRCPGTDASDQPEVVSAGPSGDLFVDDNIR